jgi:hypothetical protein
MLLPVTLSVRGSRMLMIALAVVHLVVAVGFVAIDLPTFGKLLLVAMLGLSFARVVRRRGMVRALTLGADGRLTLVRVDGSATTCEVDYATTVFSWLIVLRARTAAGMESLTLPIDALGTEAHRQLRLWLNWKASVAEA